MVCWCVIRDEIIPLMAERQSLDGSGLPHLWWCCRLACLEQCWVLWFFCPKRYTKINPVCGINYGNKFRGIAMVIV